MKIKFIGLIFSIVLFASVLSGCGKSVENNPGNRAEAAASSPGNICPLLIGQRVPDGIFLKDSDGNNFDLSTTLKKKPTLLIFYRGSW